MLGPYLSIYNLPLYGLGLGLGLTLVGRGWGVRVRVRVIVYSVPLYAYCEEKRLALASTLIRPSASCSICGVSRVNTE